MFFFSGTKNVQCYALEHNLEPHYDHWLRVRYPDKVILLMAMLLSPLRARPVHMHNAIFSRSMQYLSPNKKNPTPMYTVSIRDTSTSKSHSFWLPS